MRTVEQKVYKFDELSDSAKEAAREWWRQCELNEEWWDAVYEDAETIAAMIGIDLMPHLTKSMLSLLPKTDPYVAISGEPPVVTTMLANKWIGRNGVSGFYRLRKDGGNKIKESINLKTAQYEPSQKAQLASVERAL